MESPSASPSPSWYKSDFRNSLQQYLELFSMEKRIEYLAWLEPRHGEEPHPAISDWIAEQVGSDASDSDASD